MRVLSEQGLIARTGNMLRILEPDRLKRVANYNQRKAMVDQAWLPAGN